MGNAHGQISQKTRLYIDIEAIGGASVAKWLAHLPFTSEAGGSSLSENFLNATRTHAVLM
jgi:hypothetical protein